MGPIADSLAAPLLAAQALGRWGNWFNQELFGAPTTLPWGLSIDNAHLPSGYAPGTLFHPTFLYECLWNLAGVAVLLLIDRRIKVKSGQLFASYIMVYTLGRVWIEMLRIDDAHHFLGLRINVWTSIIVFLLGLVSFIIAGRRSASTRVEPTELAATSNSADNQDEDSTTQKADGDKDDTPMSPESRPVEETKAR